jgi:pimeloyl-ACP methyl ester carboxylesterase
MKAGAWLCAALLLAGPARADWAYRSVAGTDGVPLNVVTVGDPARPAILFIHGIGQSHYSFTRQLDSALADEFFLVAFDLRGHGRSGKPWQAEAYQQPAAWAGDVAAVIEATGIRRPVMVAWSYGTLVAMDFIRERGATGLGGLVLTGAVGALRPFRPPPADDPNAAQFAHIRELQTSPSLVDNIRASEQMVGWLTAEPLPENDRQIFQAISLMLPAYARVAMMDRRFDNQDLADALSLPTWLVIGREDSAGTLENAAELAATHDNVRLSVYEGAGHSVFFERPQRFNAELRQFARRAIGEVGSP